MNAAAAWPSLHDATLETIELNWSTGEVVLQMTSGDAEYSRLIMFASSVRRLDCHRQLPWGFSVSVNEVRGPAPTADGAATWIEIEVQSGDVIRIEAAELGLRRAP